MHTCIMSLIIRAWPHPDVRALARRLDARTVSRLPVHVSPAAQARKHVGPIHTNGDRLRLPVPDTEARQQKGEEKDATLDLILKHSDTTIATYVPK